MDFTFHSSPPTVGVEIELAILDAHTLDLADVVSPLLARLGDPADVKPEVFSCAVEVVTSPAESTRDLEDALVARLVDVRREARHLGARLLGAGLHPFSTRLVAVSAGPRYRLHTRANRYLAHTAVTFATHTHVGMPSGPDCVRVFNRLRGVMPVFLALAASSPAVSGIDTGYCCFRDRVLAKLRNYGVPPHFEDWASVEATFLLAERAGIAEGFRDVHWQLRPRPDYGTLEVRVFDAQPTIRGSLGLAALTHAICVAILQDDDIGRGPPFIPELPWWVEKENGFRASRDGLAAVLVVDEEGGTRTAREVLDGLLEVAQPVARSLGEEAHLEQVRALARHGTVAERMAERLKAGIGTPVVVAELAQELDDELDAFVLNRSTSAGTEALLPEVLAL